jgi:hypothetical protein
VIPVCHSRNCRKLATSASWQAADELGDHPEFDQVLGDDAAQELVPLRLLGHRQSGLIR